jgi:hypothetical protein
VHADISDPSFEADLFGSQDGGWMIPKTRTRCFNSTCPFGIYGMLSIPGIVEANVMYYGHYECVFQSETLIPMNIKYQACDYRREPIARIPPVFCFDNSACAKILCEMTKRPTDPEMASISAVIMNPIKK